MSILVFIFAIFLILCSIAAIAQDAGVSIVGVLFFSVLFFFVPYISLNSDVNLVISEKQYIQLEENYISDLRKQLDNFPKTDAALMNADTPISSITSSLHDAQKKLRERKESILDAKRNIAERRSGLTAYIIWFYNDELLKSAE